MRTTLLSLLAAGPVAAAGGPFTYSLVSDPLSPPSTTTTTLLTTVLLTSTTPPPPTTVPFPSFTTTTTFLSPSPPETTTTTIHSSPYPSPSPSTNDSTDAYSMSMPSVSLITPTKGPGSGSLARKPGALAALIISLCVIVTGLLVFAWFTIKRHRIRDLENQALGPPAIVGGRRSTSASNQPGHPHTRIMDDDSDHEVQSSVGREMRSSSTGHGVVSSPFNVVGAGERMEQRMDYESGYITAYPTTASSHGHSSHGHGTENTRSSSLTQIYPSTLTPSSPTLPRPTPSPRVSMSPERPPRYGSRSEAPTRRGSMDDAAYHPHRVHSEPGVLYDPSQHMFVYPRGSLDNPRHEVPPRPGPSILVHPVLPNLPPSLLRPPSETQVPTRETLRSRPPLVFLDLPLSEPHPSPAGSNVSVLSVREGLLGTPPHHPTESLASLRDDRDYSRPLSKGVGSGLRDSASLPDADSEPK